MLATETALTARPQALPFTGPRQTGRPALFGRTTEVKSAQTSKATGKDGKEAIYIGHEKYDYEGKRKGKQGRFIVDDPSKYPSKEDFGFFAGATGGWAGGEVALKEWAVKELEPVKEGPASPLPPSGSEVLTTATGKKTELKTVGKGEDIIYLGHSKDEINVRKAGAPGRFVRDDARKYPTKESIGPIVNVAGGFAGGELGVKKFARDGNLEPAAGTGRRQMQSPLIVAGIVALFGTTGALLLNDVTDVTEAVLKDDLALIDDKTKLLIEAAIGLIGVVAAVAGTRIFVRKTTETITNTAGNVAKLAAFWVALFFAARFVLEN